MNSNQAVYFFTNFKGSNYSDVEINEAIGSLDQMWLKGLKGVLSATAESEQAETAAISICEKYIHTLVEHHPLDMTGLEPNGKRLNFRRYVSQDIPKYLFRISKLININDNFCDRYIADYTWMFNIDRGTTFSVEEIPSIEGNKLINPELVIAMNRTGHWEEKIPVLVDIDSKYVSKEDKIRWNISQSNQVFELLISFRPPIGETMFKIAADTPLAVGYSIPKGKAISMIRASDLNDLEVPEIPNGSLIKKCYEFSNNFWYNKLGLKNNRLSYLKIFQPDECSLFPEKLVTILNDDSNLNQFKASYRSSPESLKILTSALKCNIEARPKQPEWRLSQTIQIACLFKKQFDYEFEASLYPMSDSDVDAIYNSGIDLSNGKAKLHELHPSLVKSLGEQNIKKLFDVGGFAERFDAARKDPASELTKYVRSNNIISKVILNSIGYDTLSVLATKKSEYDALFDIFPEKLSELTPKISNKKKYDKLDQDFNF